MWKSLFKPPARRNLYRTSWHSKMAPTSSSSRPSHRPIVVSGPSGAGKSTLLKRLLEQYPERFGFSISHTTRAPRGQERNGVEYHFISRPEFEAKVAQQDSSPFFIEHAQFGSNLYGTSFEAVEAVGKQETGKKEEEEEEEDSRSAAGAGSAGKTCILDIEMEGVKQVKDSHLNARFVFIQPPSLDVLEKRLRGRGTDDEDAIRQRLEQAGKELEFARTGGVHDRIIVNDDLERAWVEFEEFCVGGRGGEGR